MVLVACSLLHGVLYVFVFIYVGIVLVLHNNDWSETPRNELEH